MNNKSDKKTEALLLAKLYETGSLSISEAAEKCGCTIYEFIDLLKEYNISIFNYSASDLDADIINARESIKNFKNKI